MPFSHGFWAVQTCGCSTRDPKYIPCQRHLMANLFRLDPDGRIRQLGFNTQFEGRANLMPDGRILYTRWEYVDKHFASAYGLLTVNPDGTNHALYYGNYARQPRPVHPRRAGAGRPAAAREQRRLRADARPAALQLGLPSQPAGANAARGAPRREARRRKPRPDRHLDRSERAVLPVAGFLLLPQHGRSEPAEPPGPARIGPSTGGWMGSQRQVGSAGSLFHESSSHRNLPSECRFWKGMAISECSEYP